VRRDDGLVLHGAWVTAAARCAPPANRPTRHEVDTCRRWLLAELALLPRLRVVVVLGRVAHDAFLAVEGARGHPVPRPRPAFAHGAEHRLPSGLTLLCSYHPSQQNTFTGRLTRPMLARVLRRAATLAGASSSSRGRMVTRARGA
jgi:uracil-DNA glycosylase family 4